MAFCLSCCKYVAFFGIIFYISMGFIIAFQLQYLKFEPKNQNETVAACFITAVIQLLIFIGLFCWERKESQASISKPAYLKLQEQKMLSRPREQSIKGIDLVNLSGLRRQGLSQRQL